MSIAVESVSGTIQLLLQKLSPSLVAESLTSLLIGNIVTSMLRNHATPLQIALGVLINRKKIIKHMFDYKVTCSYDELRQYKKSSAVARYTKLRREIPCVCILFVCCMQVAAGAGDAHHHHICPITSPDVALLYDSVLARYMFAPFSHFLCVHLGHQIGRHPSVRILACFIYNTCFTTIDAVLPKFEERNG